MSAPESSGPAAPRSIQATLRRIAIVYHDPKGEIQQSATKLVDHVVNAIEKSAPTDWAIASNPQHMRIILYIPDAAWCAGPICSEARAKAFPLAVEQLLAIDGIKQVTSDKEQENIKMVVFVSNVKEDTAIAARVLRPPIVKVKPGVLCALCQKEAATEAICTHTLVCGKCEVNKDQIICCAVCNY